MSFGNKNLGNISGRKPASRFADKMRSLPSSQRPNTVAVIRTQDGKYIVGKNSGGITNHKMTDALKRVGMNEFQGECAEVNAIARGLNKNINLEKATISIANVLGNGSVTNVHGQFKRPCSTCDDLLEYFKILINRS